MAREKILVIDDEKEISELIQSYLIKEEFQVHVVENGKDALEAIGLEKPDLIILDIMLPDIDGIELCLEIRKQCNAPILFLSCKSEEMDKILALSVGGDDYLTKPFLPGELVARIKAHLRRNRLLMQVKKQPNIIRYPGLEINLDSHEVWVDHQLVNLSSKEFEILSILAKNPKRIYSMDQLFQMVWKMHSLDGDSRTIMVYISNLRKKIEKNPSNPKYIINIRGVGYKFNHSLFEKKISSSND
ncbi:response regulator transcription factor [Crassaminicella thermophila]|uniref:Stage 0 sporulation protein A homolog n=1 Tax=Crassaminicella thermophila TaxID=2599308 RepID=A0A5C0SJ00_CRATE|nr:response regulator transcription factor [Crassaminicella thermophila]QEK12929.1 response regulator transcription factor [Crassaminicella thermophila]